MYRTKKINKKYGHNCAIKGEMTRDNFVYMYVLSFCRVLYVDGLHIKCTLIVQAPPSSLHCIHDMSMKNACISLL